MLEAEVSSFATGAWLGRGLAWALGGVLLASAAALTSCGRNDEEARNSMPKLAHGVQAGDHQAGDRKIHYVTAGNPEQPLVLFVHGSPGDWTAFEEYLSNLSLQEIAFMVSVDRPGFGASGAGRHEASLRTQAALLAPLLERARGQGAILVGHSLGASVIARMSMDFPLLVAGLLMIAPAVDPDLEDLRWYNRLASAHLIRLLLPQALDTSNQEILPLQGELREMLPLWSRVRAPTIVIQGLKDNLVDPRNADFAEKVLVNSPVQVQRIVDAGHFVVWERPDLIKTALLQLMATAGNQP